MSRSSGGSHAIQRAAFDAGTGVGIRVLFWLLINASTASAHSGGFESSAERFLLVAVEVETLGTVLVQVLFGIDATPLEDEAADSEL